MAENENTLAREPAAPPLEPAVPPASEPAPATAPDPAPPQEPAKTAGAAERIQELVAEREAVKEWGEYWREQAMLSRGFKDGQPPAPQAASTPAADPAPTLDQFDSTEKWAAAQSEWLQREADRRAAAVVDERLKAAREAEIAEAAQTTWQTRLSDFVAKQPDAALVIQNPRLPINQAMRDVILESEQGPALAYHLGKNPAEAARIARMHPTQAAVALGRLEAQLSAAPLTPPKPPLRQTSRAPEPPTTVTGAGAPSVNLETCSLDEFLEARISRKR